MFHRGAMLPEKPAESSAGVMPWNWIPTSYVETSTLQSSSRTVKGTIYGGKTAHPENELVRYCPISMRIFWLSGATAQPPFTSSPRRCGTPPSITMRMGECRRSHRKGLTA
ncbi:hypothetical protein KIF59_17780 [Enterobacter cloacae subsp. cloacae]|nr:hypothetical protein [Enterobacter cloacae subsp. cloacae]